MIIWGVERETRGLEMVRYCVWVDGPVGDSEMAKMVIREMLGWIATISNLDAALAGDVPLLRDASMESAFDVVAELITHGIPCRYDVCP
jgi:hypothetical protein